MKKMTFSGSTGALRNPERGFRFEIGVGKIESDLIKFGHVTDHWPFERFPYVTIAQAYCYLTQYWNSEIAQEKLDALQADFDRARACGAKFLLRFAYESDGIQNGPDLDRILAHIKQLTPIVRKNADVIYVLQCGWVGLWGEFHTSIHGHEKNPEAVAKIISATLDMLPENRFTMMRRMQYKMDLLDTLGDNREITAETAFSQAPHARIGFFNDGTLANYWDGGTFTEVPYAWRGNYEYDRINREGKYMPVDGELFWTGQFNDPKDAPAIKAAERFTYHHYSTFSHVHGFSGLDHDPQPWTIDTWMEQIITPAALELNGVRFDPDYFADGERTGFEFIRDHLGYRIAMPAAEYTETVLADGELKANISLQNYGFSTPVNRRKAEFALLAADSSVIELPTDFDCRQLQPDEGCKTVSLSCSANGIAAGEYTLCLWLPDEAESLRYRPDYAIRLASNIETAETGGRLLHKIGMVRIG